MQIRYRPFLACDKAKKIDKTVSLYYEAEGGVLELLETGAPYAPHVKAKITWKRKIEICVSKLCLERGKSCVRSFQTGF